jgi:hypothetical protein
MAKKRQQSSKKKKKKKKRKGTDGGSTSSGADNQRAGGMLSGMRSGMQDVAAGQSKWWDVFLWVLMVFALLALAYRMGWIGDKPQPPKRKAPVSRKAPQKRGLIVTQPVKRRVAPKGTPAVLPQRAIPPTQIRKPVPRK